jgi:hypothetical protein
LDNAWPLIVLAGAAAVLWLWNCRRVRRQAAEIELRRICLGDRRQVERLLASELARAPGLSRAEAARRVVERYRRDNR